MTAEHTHVTALNAEGSAVSAAQSLEDFARHLEKLAGAGTPEDRAELLVASRRAALLAARVLQLATTGAAGRLAREAGESSCVACAVGSEAPF